LGVKHVEQIKSFVLFLLVSLSLMLTFSIWTYTPDYQTIEESQVEQIKISKEKELLDVLKPYRMLTHENGGFLGTSSSSAIEEVMKAIVSMDATEIRFVQSNISEKEINSMVHSDNQITLLFSAEVPINTFSSILRFSQAELPEAAFSQMLIDWSNFDQTNTLQLSFISKDHQTLYSTIATIGKEQLESTIMKVEQKSVPYEEIERPEQLSLYVPSNPVDLVQYTYYIDEISPEVFKDVLFKDANLAKKNVESNTYTDGMAMMTSDSKTKTINYAYPTAESMIEIKQSDLVQDSFEFINEHGGLTEDYRYYYSNVPKHIIEYQLYLQGLPVFSSITSTQIEVTWGGNQVFEYKRPYYIFEFSESSTRQLPSGVEMIKSRENIQDIDELVLGYYLTQDPLKIDVYSLEPCWFVIEDGEWSRITTEPVGGAQYGLE